MNGRVRHAIGLGICLALQAINPVGAQQGVGPESPLLLLRHYALSACLAQAFPAIAGEAVAAQDVYLQAGSHSPEAYWHIQALAHQWLQRNYPNFRSADLSVVKCIDFADSAAVGAIARRTLPASKGKQ